MKLEMESLEFPGTRAESPQYSHRRLTGIQEFSNSRSRNEASTTWNARSGNPHVADRVSIEISDDDT